MSEQTNTNEVVLGEFELQAKWVNEAYTPDLGIDRAVTFTLRKIEEQITGVDGLTGTTRGIEVSINSNSTSSINLEVGSKYRIVLTKEEEQND